MKFGPDAWTFALEINYGFVQQSFLNNYIIRRKPLVSLIMTQGISKSDMQVIKFSIILS